MIDEMNEWSDDESDGAESAEPNSKGFPSGFLGISPRDLRDAPRHFREYN